MLTLKRAIAQHDVLMASLIIGESFQSGLCRDEFIGKVEQMVQDIKLKLDDKLESAQQFAQLVRIFYKELAFSGDSNACANSHYGLLNHVIDYRTGIPVSIAIVFCAVAQKLGFAVSGVNFPGHFLIRYQSSDTKAVFLDPLNGNMLNWQALESLYFSLFEGAGEETMPIEALNPASSEEIISRLLHNLKAAYIQEHNYPNALTVVNLLVSLAPDDPYERRDRGFLLHQLECPQVAKADYQFFISQCPKDPSAKLLKVQMRQWDANQQMVFH